MYVFDFSRYHQEMDILIIRVNPFYPRHPRSIPALPVLLAFFTRCR
jgi:hypothetical protein